MKVKETIEQNCHPRVAKQTAGLFATRPKAVKKAAYILCAFTLLTFPTSNAHAQCANPAGVEGEKIYNENYRVMQYCDDSNWISMGKGASILHGQKTEGSDYNINAVNFDGTNDYLGNDSDELTLPDTKRLTISFWFKTNSFATNQRIFQNDITGGALEGFEVYLDSTNQLRTRAANSSGTEIYRIWPSTSFTAGQWYHVLLSLDLTDINKRSMYINDIDVTPAGSNTDDTIPFSSANRDAIGGQHGGTEPFDGDIADFWLATNTYLDLSVEANRRKFINADGQAVNLGANGELPTGSQPDIFLSGATAGWHTNLGTGGGFTENGALTDAASLPPSEYQKKLVGWWRLDETAGTTAVDSSGNGHDGTMAGGLSGTDSTTGPINTALTFDGSDDYIDIGDILDMGTEDRTLSAWIKQSSCSGGGGSIVEKRANSAGADGYGMRIHCTGSVLRGALGAASASTYLVDGTTNLSDNQWHHIVTTFERSGNMSVYVDGVLENALDISSESAHDVQSGTNLMIGSSGGVLLFNENIDDVRIYNFALDATQIAELYAASSEFYTPNAVNFDGSTHLNTGAALAGSPSDTKQITISTWIRRDTQNAEFILDATPGSLYFGPTGTGPNYDRFRFIATNDASTGIIDANPQSPSGDITDNNWHHLLLSFDLSDPTKRHYYLDDSSVSMIWHAYVDDFIDIDGITDLFIGARDTSSNQFTGDMADVWIDFGTYIDFSIPANRRKFIDASGNAAYLGADGSRPTGTQPDIFLSNPTATWHTNLGTGGGFTENGTLTDATTALGGERLPRYCSSPSQPEGTLIYNSDDHVMQYCDGYTYRPLGPQGNGGAGCTSPVGIAGMMYYNTDFATLMYCEGDEWVGVGRDNTGATLANGLLLHWQLDETINTTAADSSGNSNDGTLLNGMDAATATTNGAIATAFTFGGAASDDEISVTNASLDIEEFTFSAWVKSTEGDCTIFSANCPGIVRKISGNPPSSVSNTGWYIVQRNGAALVTLFNSDSTSVELGGGTINDGAWHLVTYTRDAAGNNTVYIDGSQVDTDTDTYTIATSDALMVGANLSNAGGGANWDGEMDDIRYYNRALGAGEIAALYNLGDCPNIGDVCNDGSIYAGLSPDGNVPMYTTPADAPAPTYRWNQNVAHINYTTTGATSDNDGNGNTATIITVDADSVVAGVQQHNAAQYCADLNAHGKTDWYLPAHNELTVLYTNRGTIGGFTTNEYYSSSESSTNTAKGRNFNTGTVNNFITKNGSRRVRCVHQ